MAGEPQDELDTEDLPPARAAFEVRGADRATDAAAVSRAATLLMLIRPSGVSTGVFRAATSEAREVLGVEPIEPPFKHRSLELELGALGPAGEAAADALRRLSQRRRGAQELASGDPASEEPASGFGFGPAEPSILSDVRAASALEEPRIEAEQRAAAQDVFTPGTTLGDERRGDAANRLVAASLIEPHPLVRVAAAAAALRLEERNALADAMLDEASIPAASIREARIVTSEEIAELSRAILTSDRQNETRRIEIEHPREEPDPDPDSAVLHGTWARRGRWWTPDGELHRYLCREQGLFPRLYRGSAPFKWSGYFSFRAWKSTKKDWNRQQAADSLAWWAERRLVARPDLIGHSYGGSVAMLATRAEKRLRGAVLLSPAVHPTCLPDPSYYERLLHVTMKLDLVLLVDLSRANLLDALPRVDRQRMRRTGLTGHSGTHDPRSWAASGLTDYVRDDWLPSLTPRI